MNDVTKLEYKKKNKLFLIKTAHFLICAALFYCAFLLFRYSEFPQERKASFRYNYFVAFLYIFLTAFFNRTYNSYLLGYSRIRGLVSAQFLSQFFSVGIIYIVVTIAWNRIRSPLIFILLLVVFVPINIIWSIEANKYYCKLNPPRKTILIYRNQRDKRRFGIITGKPTERLYKITKELQFDGDFDEIIDQLEGFEAVFVAGINSRCRNGILKHCQDHNIRGFFLPHVGDVILQGADHIQSFDSPVLMARRKIVQPEYRVIKRIMDIIGSAIGLILLSPVFLITAIAIKAYDKGPVFYKQMRLTRDGRKFRIIKFRSMRPDAEKDGIARLSTGDQDDRITPIGRIIRKCRLDEIPQLINILKGEMSIVGPRPERPEIAEQYYKTMPDFKLRLQVKAGLTGYAQIYGKYNSDPYEKLEFDLLYINQMNILTDLRMIFATFGILFSKESTAGVEGITAMDYEEE